MYNFIYWFFYKYFIWKKRFESSFIASSMVGLSIIIHFFFLYSVIRLATGWSLGSLLTQYAYGIRKLIMLPFALLLFLLIDIIFFRTNRESILSKYKDQRPFSKRNVISVFAILIIPLIISIWLTNTYFARRWITCKAPNSGLPLYRLKKRR